MALLLTSFYPTRCCTVPGKLNLSLEQKLSVADQTMLYLNLSNCKKSAVPCEVPKIESPLFQTRLHIFMFIMFPMTLHLSNVTTTYFHLHCSSLVMIGLTSDPLRRWEVNSRLNYMYLLEVMGRMLT